MQSTFFFPFYHVCAQPSTDWAHRLSRSQSFFALLAFGLRGDFNRQPSSGRTPEDKTYSRWLRELFCAVAGALTSMSFTLIDKRAVIVDMHEKTALFGRNFGGLYWTRTSDPIDVNDVLYQLSQQTSHFYLPIIVHLVQVTFLVRCPSAGHFVVVRATQHIIP